MGWYKLVQTGWLSTYTGMGTAVVMDCDDYGSKLHAMLEDQDTYRHVTKDPTAALESKMNGVLLNLRREHFWRRFVDDAVLQPLVPLPLVTVLQRLVPVPLAAVLLQLKQKVTPPWIHEKEEEDNADGENGGHDKESVSEVHGAAGKGT